MKKGTKKNIIAAALLIFIVLIIYSPAVNSPFQYDDQKVIVKPNVIKGLNILEIFRGNPFRFLLNLSFALNFFFTGLSPVGFRLVNIFLHIENTILFYLVFCRLEAFIDINKSEEKNTFITPASVSALFFAVSPLMVESVTYVSARSELLCGFFFFIALYFFISFAEKGSIYYLIISLLAGSASVLSKERGGMLLFVILLIIAFMPAKYRRAKKFFSLLPFLVFFIFYIAFRQNYLGDSFDTGFERNVQSQIFYQGEAQIKNIRLLFLPVNLCVMYPHFLSSAFPLLRFFALISAAISFIVFTVWVSPSVKWGLFCWAWFYITLAPNILAPLQDIVADRWLYLPSAGIFFLFALVLCGGLKRNSHGPLSRNIIFIIIAGCFILLCLQRNMVWKNEISLWQDAVRKASVSARPYNNFGVALGKSGRLEDARRNFMKSVSIDEHYSPAWSNFGFASKKLGDGKGVLTSAASLLKCGDYFAQRGQLKEAIISYRSVLDLVPDSIAAMGNLASIYIITGNIDVARLYLKDLLNIAPSNRMAIEMLSKIGE